MEIFENIVKIDNLALALGFFDGAHKGHQAVILSAVNYANENNKKSAVITFNQNPLEFFSKQKIQRIITNEDRRAKIQALGIDYIFELDFNEKFSKLSGIEYLRDILVKNFKPISISTGFNHNFGANKSGDAKLLEDMQTEFNYKYFNTPAEKLDGEIISSTLIREYLLNGNVPKANSMLGYNYSISGTVITGQQLGQKIGFPTANVEYPKELIELPYGVYSTIITIEGDSKEYPSITNFGKKPTVCKNCVPTIEVNIFNFDKNIYNKKIKISFVKKIRDEQKFNSIEELKTKIKEDITKC